MPSPDLEWQVVTSLLDVPSAQILAQRLIFEGVPARVISDPQLLGEGRYCEVQVPSELADRARWLLAESQFTDEELNFFATGELGTDNERRASYWNASSNRFERLRCRMQGGRKQCLERLRAVLLC
jgi:hypothetical protein